MAHSVIAGGRWYMVVVVVNGHIRSRRWYKVLNQKWVVQGDRKWVV